MENTNSAPGDDLEADIKVDGVLQKRKMVPTRYGTKLTSGGPEPLNRLVPETYTNEILLEIIGGEFQILTLPE